MLCSDVYGVGLLSFVVVNVGKKMQTYCIGLCVEESALYTQCLGTYSFSLSKSLSSAFFRINVICFPCSCKLFFDRDAQIESSIFFLTCNAFLLGQENFVQLNSFRIFGEG